MKSIFYNYQFSTPFIEQDKEMLLERFTILEYNFTSEIKIFTIWSFLHQIFILLRNWNKYDVILSQMAGYHTFLPSILSKLKLKNHFIIMHGTESNVIKDINYGNLQLPILSKITSYSLKNATHLLPVSESIMSSSNYYIDGKERKMGAINEIKNLTTPFTVIYNGVNNNLFQITNSKRKDNTFITIASGIDNERTYKLKGIDLILEVARLNPHFHFTFIGSSKIYKYKNDLPNVQIIKKLPIEELCNILNKNKFYLQLSMSEGFGLALCESMLCGCIPIVSDVGILSKIIDNFGYILSHRSASELNLIIKNSILIGDNYDPQKIRNHIVKKYSLEERSEKLIQFLSQNK